MSVYSRFGLLLLCLMMVLGLAASLGAATTYYCDNANIKLSPYTWKCSGSGVNARAEAAMPGAYFKTVVKGTTTIGIVIDGTANSGCPASSMPVIEFSIDDGLFQVMQLTQTGSVYTLDITPRGGYSSTVSHKLEVHFRAADATQNRWTTSTAHLRLVGIKLDTAGYLLSYALRSKKAICFGDSITEGVGVESLFTSWQTLSSNNARGSWFPFICCAMDCEYGTLGSNGLAMVSESILPPLPSIWDHYDANTSRLQSGLLLPEPDYVFCCVGSNDPIGSDITNAYFGWINAVRGACPHTRVFCVVPPSGVHRGEIQAAVRACNQEGDAGVYLIDTPFMNDAIHASSDAVVLFNENFSGPGDAIPNPDPDWITQATGPAPWNTANNWQVINNNGNNAYKCLDAGYSPVMRGEATINGLDLADFSMSADIINASNESWLLGHAYLSADGNFLNYTGLIVDEFMSDGCGGIGFMRFGDVSQSWVLEGYTPPTWNGTSWVIPATNPQAIWTSPAGVPGAFPHGNNKIHATLTVQGNTWSATALAYDAIGNLAATAKTGFTWDVGGATHGLLGIHSASATVMYDNITVSGVSTQMTYDGVHLSQYGQAMFAGLVAAQAQGALSSTPKLSLLAVKNASDQTDIAISGYMITAAFPDFFYIESDNRTLGLRVNKPAHGLDVGTRVYVSGKIKTNADGERYIDANTVMPVAY
ncbi:MAG: SGNH/GDSL hydrolase family protein [Armatimonadota bacterium]